MHQGGKPGAEDSLTGCRVAIFNWRDTKNPEGGGSERYVETVARGLAERGAEVTLCCAAHPEGPADEMLDGGVRVRRRGSKLTVYPHALLALATRRLGRVDVVVDVQNGLPFFTRLATRRPVIVLVHHVHREQWPVVYPGRAGKIGWWIESRLAVRLYRGSRYVAVSPATAAELATLGVRPDDISVVRNGTLPAPELITGRSPTPTLCVVGRLVPHKRVEHAIDVVALLRDDHPDLTLTVVGSGWWEERLRKYAVDRGVADLVSFLGHVSEETKHRVVAESWIQLLPSLKEGWGLVVGEAGAHGVPTIAYRSAGGTRDSIQDGVTGLLVDDLGEMSDAVRTLLEQPQRLQLLGTQAHDLARTFDWGEAQRAFAEVVREVCSGRSR